MCLIDYHDHVDIITRQGPRSVLMIQSTSIKVHVQVIDIDP